LVRDSIADARPTAERARKKVSGRKVSRKKGVRDLFA